MCTIIEQALEIDEIVVCPHDDASGCKCRKPKPGMLLALADRWDVDLRRSFVIGDSWKDVEAGRAAGCRTILLDEHKKDAGAADCVVATLQEAVLAIQSELRALRRGQQ
jgi:D-glycero-D-manno-heptose 1,7-bisphosphate phosphatase